MEIFGGFMVMMSIISLFLAVVWLIMPFVVFAIKGKQDRTLEVLETIEKRLAALEAALSPVATGFVNAGQAWQEDASADAADALSDESSKNHAIKDALTVQESAAENKDQEASPAVQNRGGD